MASTDLAATLSAFPPELISRVVEQAAQDAALVPPFLKAFGIVSAEGKPLSLPADFLREFAAATRLCVWEQQGLTLHQEAGLPSAGHAFQRVFREATARELDPLAPAPTSSLSLAVLKLTIESLAWAGPLYLNAEILLGMPDEDTLVEAMARLLWAQRQAPPFQDRSEAT